MKAPTWQGEVTRALPTATPEERAAILARVDREKYINAEARFIDPVDVALDVVLCENSAHELRGLAMVELEQAAESLTALDGAWPDQALNWAR